VRESVRIPDTKIYLTYISSRAVGYMSSFVVVLTSQRPPVDLMFVHVRVVVKGVETRQVLVARPSLTYTFLWNRQNAYNQKVYGLATAVGTFSTSSSVVSELFRAH